MSDDDFFSDDEKNKNSSVGSLMPIVEVPSEKGSQKALSTARTEFEAPNSHRTQDDINSDDVSEEDLSPGEYEHNRSRHTSKKKRKMKGRNGHNHVDMTPPDRLLKKSEKKARRYAEKNKIDASMKEYVRCTALARIVYGDGHWKLARAYADLAAAYFDLKGYPAQAQSHCDTARNIMMNSVQLTTESTERHKILEVLVNIHYTLGRALTAAKKLNDAEQALYKAEKIAKERAKLSEVSDESIENWNIKIYLAIARLSGKAQKNAAATGYFEKALEVLKDKYGDDSVELIPVYQGLGKVEQNKGEHANHERALEMFIQAHSIASAQYQEGSVEIGDTARALATAYAKVGETEAEISSESYLNEALVNYQTVYGPHHEKTVEAEDELARLMIRTERQQEGIDLLKSSMSNKHEVYGEYSAQVAETWKLLGSVYLAQMDNEKALRAFKKCHNIECLVYGQNNKKSKDTQRTIDLLLANPRLASTHKKSKGEELKDRPRFNALTSSKAPLGGFKATF